MLSIDYNIINGLMFGVAHIQGDDDDDYAWCIALGLGFLQLLVFRPKDE